MITDEERALRLMRELEQVVGDLELEPSVYEDIAAVRRMANRPKINLTLSNAAPIPCGTASAYLPHAVPSSGLAVKLLPAPLMPGPDGVYRLTAC